MRRGEIVASGLAICAVGVAMWVGHVAVHISPSWGAAIACIGAVIAVIPIFIPEKPASPVAVPPDHVQRMKDDVRQRLLVLSDRALGIAQEAKDDDEARERFYNECRLERDALREFVLKQYGLVARDGWIGWLPGGRRGCEAVSETIKDLALRVDAL